MADIPDRLEEAMVALMAKLAAEDPGATVDWGIEDAEPAETASADEVSLPSHNLYTLVVQGVEKNPAGQQKQTATPRGWQTFDLVIRAHKYERSDGQQGRALWRHVRSIFNWIEELDENGSKRGARQWWIEWRSAAAIQDESGRAPTPGARIVCAIGVNQ